MENPLISFLPYFAKATTYNPTFSGFSIVFSSGTKSVTVGSFVRSDTHNMGLAAGANGQSLRAWDWNQQKENTGAATSSATACESRPFTLAGSPGRNETYYYADGTSVNQASALIQPIKIYFGKDAGDNYSVYTDIAMNNESNKETFTFNETDVNRYLIADLSGYTSAHWTAFTEDEFKNVNVTLQLLGVTAESKFLITELNGQAVTQEAVNGYSVGRVSTGAVKATDGIVRTLTSTSNTLTVANDILISDNDALTPLASVALLPKNYGSAIAAVSVDKKDSDDSYHFWQSTNAGFGNVPNQSNKYFKSEALRKEYEDAIAAWENGYKRDIEALYVNFNDTDGNELLSVQLGYRGSIDAGGDVTFKASVGGSNVYRGISVVNGEEITASAVAAIGGARFDGYVNGGIMRADGSTYTAGKCEDPVYNIYYDAENNALYTDTGRSDHLDKNNARVNLGSESNPNYRWKIVDLNALGFTGFGDNKVTMTVTATLRDHDEDGLEDESAHVGIMSVDGQALTNDGTNVTAAAVTSKPYVAKSSVYAEVGKEHTAQAVKTYTLLSGTETDVTGYAITSATDPSGAAVTVSDGKFTPVVSGDYTVKLTKADNPDITYKLYVGGKYTTNELFTAVGSTNKVTFDTVIEYAELPSEMAFSGSGIRVTTQNSTGKSHLYTWGDAGEKGMGASASNVYIGTSGKNSVIKLAFPGAQDMPAKYSSTAITYVITLTDPTTSEVIYVYFVANSGSANALMEARAIGSWEVMSGYKNRLAPWTDDSGNLKFGTMGSDGNRDWVGGLQVGARMRVDDSAPVELKFNNETGELWIAYGTTEKLLRNFKTQSAANDSAAENYDSKLSDSFSESGFVNVSVGVDMPNWRGGNEADTNSTTFTPYEKTAYTIMSLGGVELSEVESGYIIDPTPVLSYAYTGATQIYEGERVTLKFTETRTLGTKTATYGEYKLDDATLTWTGEKIYNITGLGDHPLSFKGEGDKEITATITVLPKLTFVVGEHGSVTIDGEAYDSSTPINAKANHTIVITPATGYEVEEFKLNNVAQTLGNNTFAHTSSGGAAAYTVTFKAINYTITYELDGGEVTHTNPTSYTVECDDITLAAPTASSKTGYTFADWSITTIDTSEAQNVTVTAQWTKNNHTISFVTNVTDVTRENQTVAYGDKIPAPAALTKTGYTFGGWYASSDFSGEAWNFGEDVIGDADVTLYAKWDVVNYTISYNLDDGSVTGTANPTSYTVETTAITLTAPSKTGYEFKGWYIDATFTTEWTYVQGTTTGDVTLYAKFDINSYTVTFDSQNGSSVPDATVDYNSLVTKPTDPTKNGYVFKGWYKEDTFATEWNFTTDKVTDDTTLYAKWNEVFEVTFNVNGGEGTIAAQNVENGGKATAPTTAPTRTGYTFGGWYKEAACNNAFDFTTETITAATELFAKWDAVEYDITYNTNGGTAITAGKADYDTKLTKPTTDPTKTGYAFDKWYKDAALTTEWNFATDKVTGDTTLYAGWTANEYTATFNSDGGTPVTDETIYHDGKVTEPTDPTKEGYTFGGWFLSGATEAYDFDTTVTGDVALTAKWTINTYTVTFSDGVAAQTVNHGGKATEPTDPTKAGYTFAGWYVGDTAYDFNTVVTADVTLTAKWTEVPADTTPEAPVDTDKKEGCGKEAVGTLAFVLTALGAVLVIKRK